MPQNTVQNPSVPAFRRKRPYVFEGTIGTAVVKPFENLFYDSIFISNDSVNVLSFDIAGSGFMTVQPNERLVLERIARANDFSVFASVAGSQCRIMLWNSER